MTPETFKMLCFGTYGAGVMWMLAQLVASFYSSRVAGVLKIRDWEDLLCGVLAGFVPIINILLAGYFTVKMFPTFKAPKSWQEW